MNSFRSRTHRAPMFFMLIALSAMMVLANGVAAQTQAQATESQAALITNKTCPVTLGEPIDPEQWVEYQDQRVYLCCRTCKRQFEANPKAYLANLPRFASAAAKAMASGELAKQTDGAAPGSHANYQHVQSEPAGSQTELGHTHAASAQEPALSAEPRRHDEAVGAGNQESDEHDHIEHGQNGGKTGLARLVYWLGKFHPLSDHFPIALLLSGALAELLFMASGRRALKAAARFCVWLGGLGAVAAVVLGWFFAGFRLTDPNWILSVHRWLGTAAGLWVILLLGLELAAGRAGNGGGRWLPWYRLVLFLAAGAVAVNGFIGGALIYGLNHYAW